MSLFARLKRIGIDTYMLLLIATVFLATVLPATGRGAVVLSHVAYYAIALLFFVYGAKLNTSAVVAGLTNWRLQFLVLAFTYIVFPLLGLGLFYSLKPFLDEFLGIGLLFLAVLPSTVQASIAFTSLAQGNVPAAVCAASLSNVIGVFLTPALAALLLQTSGSGINTDAIKGIALQILLPFILGQLARPLIGGWIVRQKMFTLSVDRGSILLIVYSAFSAGMVAGIWSQIDGQMLAIVIGADVLLLAVIILLGSGVGRLAKLPREDRMALFFCGVTKSLASGLPIANILFIGKPVSLIIVPLMLFHQIQLFVCAIIARRHANRLVVVPG
ncbi:MULTISPECIES: bile acid:sodium symporter family protein [Chelativorans]|jgi:sodium/bile acid cotransporter 7|uniref:Bile acid:sodium symporter n=1 Tax=Chelativorans sp. (strain BNC1) TaxID=266779 RepID=Q11FF7_CHESB|nr:MULTISPECIES: bile acid:sodium symporter family protein [Chelativorans]